MIIFRSVLLIFHLFIEILKFLFKLTWYITKFIFATLLSIFGILFLKSKNIKFPPMPDIKNLFNFNSKDKKEYINYEDLDNTVIEETFYKKNTTNKNPKNNKKESVNENYNFKDTFTDFKKEKHEETKIFKTFNHNNKKEYNLFDVKYLEELNILKENLSGDIAIKTNRIIETINKILSFLDNNPNRKDEIYPILKCDLLKTIELLSEYNDLSVLKFKTESVNYTLRDIEMTIDTVLISFSKLLDRLYKNNTSDVEKELERLKELLKNDEFLENTNTLY